MIIKPQNPKTPKLQNPIPQTQNHPKKPHHIKMNYAPEIGHAIFGQIGESDSDALNLIDDHLRIKLKDAPKFNQNQQYIYAKWLRRNEDGYYPTHLTEYKFYTLLPGYKEQFQGKILKVSEFGRKLKVYDYNLRKELQLFIPRFVPNFGVGTKIQVPVGGLLDKSNKFCLKTIGAFESSKNLMDIEIQ